MPRGRPRKVNSEESVSLAEQPVVTPVEAVQANEPIKPIKQKPKYNPPIDPKWTLRDPRIPTTQKDSRWVAVFKCTNPEKFHKTKALNITPESEVPCHVCGWPTKMDPMFLSAPINWRERRVREPERGLFEGAIDE